MLIVARSVYNFSARRWLTLIHDLGTSRVQPVFVHDLGNTCRWPRLVRDFRTPRLEPVFVHDLGNTRRRPRLVRDLCTPGRRPIFVEQHPAGSALRRLGVPIHQRRHSVIPRGVEFPCPELLSGLPAAVVVQRRVPEWQGTQAGNPRLVSEKLVCLASLVEDLNLGDQPRAGTVGAFHSDRHQIAASGQEPRYLVAIQLAGRSSRTHSTPVDIQFVSVAGRDGNSALTHRRNLKRFAKMAGT